MRNIKKIIVLLLVICSFIFICDDIKAITINSNNTNTNTNINTNKDYLVKNKSKKNSKKKTNKKTKTETDSEGVPIIKFDDLKNGKKKEFKVECEDWEDLHGLWTIMRVGAPFLYIIFAAFDFFKIVMAGGEEEIKKAKKTIPKRLIIFILFLLIPSIIGFIVGNFGSGYARNFQILRCILKGSA